MNELSLPALAAEPAGPRRGGTEAPEIPPATAAPAPDLGHVFRDPELLRLALTHPSVSHECGQPLPDNQRLEFLGDAVLQLILTRELYDKFPDRGEGPLTQARAEMVNSRTLAREARALELGRRLIMSRGEEQSGGRERTSALADAFEAVLGAIYLDGGMEAAREFVLRRFHAAFGRLADIPNIENPKGELQERLQAETSEAPVYRLAAVSGPDHDRAFVCEVTHRGRLLGTGHGKSKKAAESEAARAALLGLSPLPKPLPAGDDCGDKTGAPRGECAAGRR